MDTYYISKYENFLLRIVEENVPFNEITKYGTIISPMSQNYDPDQICGYLLIKEEETYYAIKENRLKK